MGCQIMDEVMWILDDKSIGDVIFVVEGAKNEFSLLKRVLTEILHYEYIRKNRHEIEFYEKKIEKKIALSRIAVVNTETSNINSLDDINNFLDNELSKLAFQYGFDIDNSAIFYIFDRDRQSNQDISLIRNYIEKFRNPYDNGFDRGGLLLLSYPAVESYTVSSFIDDAYMMEFALGKNVKTFIGDSGGNLELTKMNKVSILKAVNEMMKYFAVQDIQFVIDQFDKAHLTVLDSQEGYFTDKAAYQCLSLLSVAFIYLGIIELD